MVAIFDARADAGGGGGAPSLKVAEARCVLKLGTSADYALCGARTKARPVSKTVSASSKVGLLAIISAGVRTLL